MFGLEDEAVKKGILAGIISSILMITLIQPLFDFLSAKIISLISNSFNIFANYLYKEAALGARYKIGVMYSAMISGSLLGFIIGFIISRQNLGKKDILLSKHSRKLSMPTLVGLILISFLLSGQALFENTINELNLSFQQRLSIISPYITEREEKALKAKWASMKNASDYKEINALIDKYAKINNISVPKSL